MEEKTMVRIFVGGLGESVTGDELRRVFELSGGSVEALEFVRSKHRSFAYVDFSPSTEKSLSILFAKYNGCMWKGGKLRLEKAKEHYLKRLEREWEEEANLDQVTEEESSESPQDLIPPENRSLRLFFPRLRTVRVVPFLGTGKHKYSFQRIDLTSPPKYFCDCEEHSTIAETKPLASRVDPESVGGGVNPEELDIMSQVMNKLFQKHKCEAIVDDVPEIEEENDDDDLVKHKCDAIVDDKPEIEEENDDDDLVINFASKGGDEFASFQMKQLCQASRNQAERGTVEQRSKRGRSQEKKCNDGEPKNKKEKPLARGQNGADGFKSAIPEDQGGLYTDSDKPSKIVEAKSVEPETSKRKSNAHVSWSQKSSWKKLVGDKVNSTFSIGSTEVSKARSDPPDEPVSKSTKKNLENDVPASTEKSEPIFDDLNVPDSDSVHENLEKESEVEVSEMNTEEPVEAQPAKPDIAVSSQTKRGSSWMQKSSWTQLLGENGSFSISQSVPFTAFQQAAKKPNEGNALSLVNASLNDRENQACETPHSLHTEENAVKSSLKDAEQAASGNEFLKSSDEKCDAAATQVSPVRVEVSETCTFMRNATSLKEWSKAKAALSGSLKRKGNQK